jgi:hypothetical protein
MTRNLYPNVLGFNIKSGIQHVITGFTRLAPELGTKYGYATVLRASYKVALNFREYSQLAEKMGNRPAEFMRNGEAALAEGMYRSKAMNWALDKYNSMAKVAMFMIEHSVRANRAVAVASGEIMAHDIAAGSKLALNSLSKFPRSLQQEILTNPGDAAGNSIKLGRYLNDTTMFNFNRASMSELGREMGPIFAQFSTWPTNIFGELAYTYRSKGAVSGTMRNLERLVVPWALLSVANLGIGMRYKDHSLMVADPDSLSDRMRKTIGSGGFAAMAPVHAMTGFINGELFSPPVVHLITQAGTAAINRNPREAGKLLDSVLSTNMPGAGPLRFMTDDMVTYITGHRPEGTNFIERTQAGARIINRKLTK